MQVGEHGSLCFVWFHQGQKHDLILVFRGSSGFVVI